jgi:hypothetical protein
LEKNILFLLYNFPPEFGTAPKRTGKWLTIFCRIVNNILLSLRRRLTEENENSIFEISAFDYRNLISLFSRSGYVSESVKNNPFSRFFIKLINTFPINILFGEGGGIYLFNAYRKACRLIQEHSITHYLFFV